MQLRLMYELSEGRHGVDSSEEGRMDVSQCAAGALSLLWKLRTAAELLTPRTTPSSSASAATGVFSKHKQAVCYVSMQMCSHADLHLVETVWWFCWSCSVWLPSRYSNRIKVCLREIWLTAPELDNKLIRFFAIIRIVDFLYYMVITF